MSGRLQEKDDKSESEHPVVPAQTLNWSHPHSSEALPLQPGSSFIIEMSDSGEELQNVIKYIYYETGQIKWGKQGDKCGMYEREQICFMVIVEKRKYDKKNLVELRLNGNIMLHQCYMTGMRGGELNSCGCE